VGEILEILVLVLGRSVFVRVLVLENIILEILDEVYFIKKVLYFSLSNVVLKSFRLFSDRFIHIHKCITHSFMTIAMSYFP
jgi:hypothetical protein